MTTTLYPSKIDGRITAPSSKSLSIRALAAACLGNGKSVINNFSNCSDSLNSLAIVKALGAKVEEKENHITIVPPIAKIEKASFSVGESALAFRLFSIISTFFAHEIKIKIEGSLIRRDLEIPIAFFKQHGVLFQKFSNTEYLVSGNLFGSHFNLPEMKTSQWLSAMLYVTPLLSGKENAKININSLISRDYVNLTTYFLSSAGIKIFKDDMDVFIVPNQQSFLPLNMDIEGDWSGGAFFLTAAAIGGEIRIQGLNLNSEQPDKLILTIINNSGAKVSIADNVVRVVKPDRLNCFKADLSLAPDLFPVVSILAACSEGFSTIRGLNRLTNKESNRLKSTLEMFKNLGITYHKGKDVITIKGGEIKAGSIRTYSDHRIAMAAAVSSFAASGPVTIDNPECVSKSYPSFWIDFKNVQKAIT